MAITFEQYVEALKYKNRYPIAKIEWTDSNGLTTREVIGDLVDGTLTSTYTNGMRRTVSLELQNTTGDYTPTDEDGLIWFTKGFKLFTGLRINDEDYFNPQGVFVLGNPTVNHNFAERTMSLQAYDLFAKLDGTLNGILLDMYHFPVGSNAADVFRVVFNDAGLNVPVIINPTLETKTIPYTLTADLGETYADILLNKLQPAFTQDIYFDEVGNAVIDNPTQQQSAGSVWRFSAENVEETLYIGGSKTVDFNKMYNKVKVVGQQEDGTVFSGEAEDDNIFSSTFVGKIGNVTFFLEDEQIYTDDLATLRAQHELNKGIQLYEIIQISCVPLDIIKEGDIITITDIDLGLDEARCLVTSFNIPLRHDGVMDITCVNTRNAVDIVLL